MYIGSDAQLPFDSGRAGRGPGAMVKAACLESHRSRVRTPFRPTSFKETKMFPFRLLVKIH